MLAESHFSPLLPFRELHKTWKPELSFDATTVADWRLWRDRFRARLTDLLGGFPQRRCDLEPKTVETVEFGDYRREKVLLQAEPFATVPAYVLIPKGADGLLPAMLALHGHGSGAREVIGEVDTEEERQHVVECNHDYGRQLARAGYFVIAPDQRGFGERREQEQRDQGPMVSSCRQLSFNAMLFGKITMGLRVWDAMRCLDYLGTRPEVDATRIGSLGLSGGGLTTFYAAPLNERIKVAVISGYFNTFWDSILAMAHCECNYVPGILRYAEMYDVAALIAPRPLLIESGTQDPIFPVDATRLAYEKLRRVYELLGVSDRLDIDIFEGPHKFSGAKAFEFLRKWL